MSSKNKSSAPSARNSSVEMLRIIAMMMIVISHASVHGGFPDRASSLEINNHLLNWVVLGNLGVNIYLLITGYFLCIKQMTVKSVLKNLTQVWFYSILCGFFHIVAGGTVSPTELLGILFPTIFKEYWFFTAYFVLLLISPCLNIFAHNASRKQFEGGLLTMFVLWCVILSFTNQDMYSSEIIQFAMYYLAGAFIRLYPDNYLAKKNVRNLLTVLSFVLLFLSSSAIRFVNETIMPLISETSFTHPFSVFSFGASVGLFSLAVYHKEWVNSFVNTVGSCTFGVYLIHENPFLRNRIWHEWINNTLWYDSGLLILRILASVLLVFITCIPIELLRQKIIAKPSLAAAEKVAEFLCHKCKSVGTKSKMH